MSAPPAAGAMALRIRDLHAFYGESHVLHGVDLDVAEGEVVTLLGRNGSGRTSTLKSILGLVGRRTGSVQVDGQETVGMAPHRIARSASATARRSAGSLPACPPRRICSCSPG